MLNESSCRILYIYRSDIKSKMENTFVVGVGSYLSDGVEKDNIDDLVRGVCLEGIEKG